MSCDGIQDTNLVAGVVRMAGENGEGTVHLLSQYDASELMRQGHATKRKKQIGTLACRRRPPIRRSDAKHQALDSLIADAAEVRRQRVSGVLMDTTIQKT